MTKVLKRVPLEVSIHWRYLHPDERESWLEIPKMKSFGKYSKATICRHRVKNIDDLVPDKRKQNQGRPTKLWDRQKRNILRQAKLLQEEVGNFSVERVMVRAGIPASISTATVRRVKRKTRLKWSHAQKKGVLTKSDLKLRLKFSGKVHRKLPKDFWTGGVGFYLDGESFTHKMNPFEQARAPRAKVWRKPGQGLGFRFTATRRHGGTGGSVAHFMAAIAYEQGVVGAELYFGRINADTFSFFDHEHFASMLKNCPNPKGKLFLQDGVPSQKSCKARST